MTQLLSTLGNVTGVPESQITNLITQGGGVVSSPGAFSSPVVQNNLLIVLQILSGVVGQPLRETNLNSLLTTSAGKTELENLFVALQNAKRQGSLSGFAGSAPSGVDTYARQQYNQGVLVPVDSNSEFKTLSRGGQQGSSRNKPQAVGSSPNRPIIVGSSGSGKNLPLEPVPTSIFDRLNNNRRQPIYIFTRVDSMSGGIISPNLIFRVNFTAGSPVQPYLLTYLDTSIAQPILRSLLAILNEYSNGPEDPTYLLSRLNQTSGVPIPPFLLFHTNRATGQQKAPYVLSRLDLPSGRPTQPEILQYLDRETGQPIVNEMLPLLNKYIARDSRRT